MFKKLAAASVLVIFLLSAVAQATPSPAPKGVVVTTPGISVAQAKAYATSHDKWLLSDFLDHARPGDDEDSILRQKLDRAQRAWLGGRIEEARSEFRGLSELALKADWKAQERDVIQTSLLRLAQIAESSSERSSWLESAARLYADVEPNTSLFPPPLLNEYQATLKRLESGATDVDLRDEFPDFRYVLIDGRKFEIALQPRARILSGTHRFTGYSDSHEAVTEFMTAAQLRVMRLSPPPLTEGLCSTSRLRSRVSVPGRVDVEIYSGPDCPPVLNAFPERLSVRGGDLRLPEMPADSTQASKKTWLWIVGGALLAGAAYAVATQTFNSSAEATHRSGF